jgi:hypothetical protein
MQLEMTSTLTQAISEFGIRNSDLVFGASSSRLLRLKNARGDNRGSSRNADKAGWFHERQRRSVTQPRVARNELPWVIEFKTASTLKETSAKGVASRLRLDLFAAKPCFSGYSPDATTRADSVLQRSLKGLQPTPLPARMQPFQGWRLLAFAPRVAPAAQPWADGLERLWRSRNFVKNHNRLRSS